MKNIFFTECNLKDKHVSQIKSNTTVKKQTNYKMNVWHRVINVNNLKFKVWFITHGWEVLWKYVMQNQGTSIFTKDSKTH